MNKITIDLTEDQKHTVINALEDWQKYGSGDPDTESKESKDFQAYVQRIINKLAKAKS